VFSYTLGGREVLDAPSVEVRDGKDVFVRTFEIGPGDQRLVLRAAEAAPGRDGKAPIGLELINSPAGLTIESTGGWLGVAVPASRASYSFTVRLRPGSLEMRREAPSPPLPSTLIHGGPARYPRPVITRGVLGPGGNAYVVDTLTPPADNPWKSFLRFGGLDFFSNGDAAVCSVSGDVWVVSGIDESLKELKWRRFATGLFQPLGLRIVEDKVYVLGRDQITRLHDLNNDGEADFYENFNNDAKVTANPHGYVTCLETDPAGNFYYLKCGDDTEHGGTVLRVSRDGGSLDVYATGLRNPNGAGVSPTGVVTVADNQGEWVPASRLDVVKPGQFLGFQPMSKRNPPPTDPGKPLCWMPQNVDNSSGGQTWVKGGRWGPFEDYMVHTSYGAAALLLVLQEEVNGQPQGGVVRFPFTFDSGIMRGRFRPRDGQLYVCGLRGWQTAGVKDAALHRVRYTGKPVYMPSGLNATRNGLKLTFTCPLAEDTAGDPDSYSILRWNYHWSAEYGSRQWSISDPSKQGYDTLKVTSAKLLPDGKSVFLEVEDMRPAMQMQIGYDVEAKDGTQVRGEVYNTVHALRP
jgi:glucose/arabinose dehydrogenase